MHCEFMFNGQVVHYWLPKVTKSGKAYLECKTCGLIRIHLER